MFFYKRNCFVTVFFFFRRVRRSRGMEKSKPLKPVGLLPCHAQGNVASKRMSDQHGTLDHPLVEPLKHDGCDVFQRKICGCSLACSTARKVRRDDPAMVREGG